MKKIRNLELMAMLGENLKNLRLARNISQEYLAEDAKISQTSIARIERGKLNTSISTLYALMKALQAEANEFFGTDYLT